MKTIILNFDPQNKDHQRVFQLIQKFHNVSSVVTKGEVSFVDLLSENIHRIIRLSERKMKGELKFDDSYDSHVSNT